MHHSQGRSLGLLSKKYQGRRQIFFLKGVKRTACISEGQIKWATIIEELYNSRIKGEGYTCRVGV